MTQQELSAFRAQVDATPATKTVAISKNFALAVCELLATIVSADVEVAHMVKVTYTGPSRFGYRYWEAYATEGTEATILRALMLDVQAPESAIESVQADTLDILIAEELEPILDPPSDIG